MTITQASVRHDRPGLDALVQQIRRRTAEGADPVTTARWVADVLERVFGAVGHAAAERLADLSPHMDELFLIALAELAAPTYIKYLT